MKYNILGYSLNVCFEFNLLINLKLPTYPQCAGLHYLLCAPVYHVCIRQY